MAPIIREYRTGDMDRVLALSIDAWTPGFDSIRELLGDEMFRLQHGDDWREYQRASVARTLEHAKQTWVAEVDGVVAGFASVNLLEHEPIGEIVMIAVDPAFQRSGLSTQLLDSAERFLR